MRLLLILLTATIYAQDEVPYWVLKGILKVETSSSYTEDGSIKYVDKRRGTHGERGPFQMTKIAFNQIKLPGEQFWQIETDRVFAEQCAMRYLCWLYDNTANKNWKRTIQQYNAGPYGKSQEYLEKVLLACNK